MSLAVQQFLDTEQGHAFLKPTLQLGRVDNVQNVMHAFVRMFPDPFLKTTDNPLWNAFVNHVFGGSGGNNLKNDSQQQQQRDDIQTLAVFLEGRRGNFVCAETTGQKETLLSYVQVANNLSLFSSSPVQRKW